MEMPEPEHLCKGSQVILNNQKEWVRKLNPFENKFQFMLWN